MRLVASVALSLLLLGLQHRLVAHEIEHLGARLHHGANAVVQAADGGPCLECALLAGGSNAVPLDGVLATASPARPSAPVDAAYASPRRTLATAYLSRAPPVA